MNFKAHDYRQVYEDLGIDLSLLGCIMLDVHPINLEEIVKESVIPALEYYAQDSKRFWIQGVVAGEPHVTLLYGLMRSGPEMKKHVDAVLDGHVPQQVTIDHVGYFPSPYEDEPYYCIVAHLKVTPELAEANERLKMLPHLNTFPGFKAHVTLAYMKKDETMRDRIVGDLNVRLRELTFPAGSLNYGGKK